MKIQDKRSNISHKTTKIKDTPDGLFTAIDGSGDGGPELWVGYWDGGDRYVLCLGVCGDAGSDSLEPTTVEEFIDVELVEKITLEV